MEVDSLFHMSRPVEILEFGNDMRKQTKDVEETSEDLDEESKECWTLLLYLLQISLFVFSVLRHVSHCPDCVKTDKISSEHWRVAKKEKGE